MPILGKKTQVEAIMEKKDYGIPKSSTVETTNCRGAWRKALSDFW